MSGGWPMFNFQQSPAVCGGTRSSPLPVGFLGALVFSNVALRLSP